MATGRLGTASLSAATYTSVYQVPTGYFTVATVSICNRSNQAISLRLSISSTTTPSTDEFLEYDTEIAGKGVLERTGLVMAAGQYLIVYSSTANVSAVCYGIETPTT